MGDMKYRKGIEWRRDKKRKEKRKIDALDKVSCQKPQALWMIRRMLADRQMIMTVMP